MLLKVATVSYLFLTVDGKSCQPHALVHRGIKMLTVNYIHGGPCLTVNW
jgi:hypothetical protein